MTQGALQQEKSSKKREGGAWGSNSMVSNTGGLSHELHVLFRIDKFVPIFFFFFEEFLTKASLRGHQVLHGIDFG